MKFLVGLALCCAAIFVVADATSAGAPIGACNDLTPQHPGTTEQAGDNPWMIDISSFNNGSGYYYIPGYTYNVTLRRVDVNDASSMNFRGFFIQGRTELTDMMVGAFNTPTLANTRLSSCTPEAIGVTHSNDVMPRVEFSDPLTFKWVAPAEGTGPILFRYSVVQVFATWWANDVSGIVQEQEVPDDQPTEDSGTPRMQENTTSGTSRMQGVGLWTLLMVTVFTVALKAVLW